MVTIHCYRSGFYYHTYHMPYSRFYTFTNHFDDDIMSHYRMIAQDDSGNIVYERYE